MDDLHRWVVNKERRRNRHNTKVSRRWHYQTSSTTEYTTTNNEADYEALLTGLKLAKILGAIELDIHSDSQLIVGQVNGNYEAKEKRMQQYLDLVRHQMGIF